MKTIVKKYQGFVRPKIWEWQIIQDGKVIAGGYGRIKKDATNDLNVWLRLNAGTEARLPVKPASQPKKETNK